MRPALILTDLEGGKNVYKVCNQEPESVQRLREHHCLYIGQQGRKADMRAATQSMASTPTSRAQRKTDQVVNDVQPALALE